jgi:hypothetical protein
LNVTWSLRGSRSLGFVSIVSSGISLSSNEPPRAAKRSNRFDRVTELGSCRTGDQPGGVVFPRIYCKATVPQVLLPAMTTTAEASPRVFVAASEVSVVDNLIVYPPDG